MKRSLSLFPSLSCNHQSKKSASIEYGANFDDLLHNLRHATKYESGFYFLKINNIPTIAKGIDLIQQSSFKTQICSYEKIIGINLKINELIDENFNEKPHFYDLWTDKNIFIGFQSILGGHESKTYWKDPNCGRVYSLFIDDDETEDVAEFFHEFLIDELRNNRNGLLWKSTSRRTIHLHEIGDYKGRNLLYLAIIQTKENVVKNLLKHEFDPDDEIDLAWTIFLERRSYESAEIILHLLKANSRFPRHFDYNEASRNVQEFVDFCETLHVYIDFIRDEFDQENIDELKKKMELMPNLMYYYNRHNQSLLAYIIITKKNYLIKNLENGLNSGSHEDLKSIYSNLESKELNKLGFNRQKTAATSPESHLFALKSRTKIGNNDQFHHKHWKYIDEAYRTVNSNSYCSKILKLAAKHKSLKIFFDFKHDTIYYMDPPNFQPSGKAFGAFNSNFVTKKCTIIIGAKFLTDEVKKIDVFKVLAHEFCHLAVNMSFYQPECEPYPLGESQVRTEYQKAFIHCRENKEHEKIISNIFKSYNENDLESELIVAVPEMLILYQSDLEKLDELRLIFRKLFEFSSTFVEPEIEKTLKILDVLEDKSEPIIFVDLTASMKAKILNTTILFQGFETSLQQLTQNDENIGRDLTVDDIRKILIDDEILEFGDTCELSLKHEFVERKFVKRSNSNDQEGQSIYEISDEIKTSSIFILADHAATGKSTIFKHQTLELKKMNPNFWISFINLRKCMKYFEDISASNEEISVHNIQQILFEIINLESLIEYKIFKNLYLKNQVILLFDGLDEICPKYTDIMFKIFKVIRTMEPKIELWISSRPNYAEKLENFFKVSSYKFMPYSIQELISHFESVVTASKFSDEEKVKFLSDETFINSLEYTYTTSKNISLMMIEMMTEVWMDSEMKDQYFFCYELFEGMIEKQKKKIGDKIPIEDHDRDSRINVWDIHRILALIYIFGTNFEDLNGFKFEELSIMKKWKKEMKNWTSDMIQRYGFVVVELNDVEKSISFNHRLYAEFFVAQFLISSISDDNDCAKDEELTWILQLFDFCLEIYFDSNEIRAFIKSYFECKAEQQNFVFHEVIRKKILKNISNAYLNLIESKDADLLVGYVVKYSEAIKIDLELSYKLWKIDYEFCIFEEILASNSEIRSFLFECAQECFGVNWHEMFNKTDAKLIRNEDIVHTSNTKIEYIQNFHKFCDLLDKNFETKNKIRFYTNIIENEFRSDLMDQKKLVQKIRNAFGREKFLELLIFDTNFNFFTFKPLKTAFDILDQDNHNQESFENILKKSIKHQSLSLITSASIPHIFPYILKFYKKYNPSTTDLKCAIMSCSPYDIICPTQFSTYKRYKKLIQNIFGTDTSELAAKIKKFFRSLDGKIEFNLKKLENLKDFLSYVFKNDDKRVIYMLRVTGRKRWVKRINLDRKIDYSDLRYPSMATKELMRSEAMLQNFNDRSYYSNNAYILSQRQLNKE